MWNRLVRMPRLALRAVQHRANRRVSRWVRHRQGDDTLPVALKSNRIYILPTRVGVTLAVVAFAMLLGSMNYNNSMGFALTFMLGALGLVAMHHCHRNLAGMRVVSVAAEPVFAGQTAEFVITVENDTVSPRFDVYGSAVGTISSAEDLPAVTSRTIIVSCQTHSRGVLSLARFGVMTQFPLGLFRAWAWIHADNRCIVAPMPAVDAPPRPAARSDAGIEDGSNGDEDFAGLRNFQRGDPPRHIAWKTFARTGELKSKQFSGSDLSTAWLDFDAIDARGIERRLAILTRWVLDADAAGDRYGLRLPGLEIPRSSGAQHRRECLRALALYGDPEVRYADG